MCIFSQPIISVNNTQIFARPSGNGTQFLAYQMSYESGDENAMILPVPVRTPSRDDSLRFIDLQGYESFFDDLADGFPYSAPSFSIACSSAPGSLADLEVFEIGNYIASFVPTLEDFGRLDARFTLPPETWARVPQYKNYGFAVFQLASGALKPHPMAFEFETDRESIYFPTLHIHDGEVHEIEDFDHILYMQHAGFDSRAYGYVNSNVADESTGLVRSKYVADRFCDISATKGIADGNLLVHRKNIRGNKLNRDIEILTTGDPVNRSFNFRPLRSYLPWFVVAGAIAWFFHRRNRIKRLRSSV
jgi:hypothetical protein